ncbi:hypothetical protein J0A68_09610 [Algoriphagus sp. H41]|uniref:Uncharacterized protein n=1 Tax=Algoriphagus oliviformis TaxID=2811231 RepID=A0ABS3C264_9BACT|nr:hypothetical protein [Algoriphagus oliviformis]MBN7811213.1 hypothetical protein [Algoriphagus oliviformis]
MELARLILDTLIILLGLWVLFYKAYFTEKGKNIATKEDIQEITSKIELVKLEFLKKIEFNKYALNLNHQLFNALNSLQNSLRTINRDQSESGIRSFWRDFEKNKNDISRLHINYSSTYYSQYQAAGSNFERAINKFIESSKTQDHNKTLKNINSLINSIEEYKKEIHNCINI